MPSSCERRDVLLSGLGGLVGSLSGCAGTGNTAAEPTDETGSGRTTRTATGDRNIRVIAHRGCADQYPENTVLAVERSAPHVDMVEVDVQRCASGELVVFHDDDIDGLTGASGAVSTTDWATLRELTVLDPEEGVPLLSDLLAAVPAETGVNVELKRPGMAADVLEAAEEVDNKILYSSFSGEALRELRALNGVLAPAYLVDHSPDIGVSTATDIGCVAVNPSVDLVLGTDVVEQAHDEGLLINAWTVDDAETATTLREAGVDGLFVDRWDIV